MNIIIFVIIILYIGTNHSIDTENNQNNIFNIGYYSNKTLVDNIICKNDLNICIDRAWGLVYGKDRHGYINITFLEVHNNIINDIQYKEFFKLFSTEWSVGIAYKDSIYPMDVYLCTNNNGCIHIIYKLLRYFETMDGNIDEIYFSFYSIHSNDCYDYNFTKWLELM